MGLWFIYRYACTKPNWFPSIYYIIYRYISVYNTGDVKFMVDAGRDGLKIYTGCFYFKELLLLLLWTGNKSNHVTERFFFSKREFFGLLQLPYGQNRLFRAEIDYKSTRCRPSVIYGKLSAVPRVSLQLSRIVFCASCQNAKSAIRKMRTYWFHV